MKITIISVSSPLIASAIKSYDEINKAEEILDLKLYYAVGMISGEKRKNLIHDIESADAVIVDLMGSYPEYVSAVYEGLPNCKGQIIPYGNSCREYMRLGEFSPNAEGKKPSMEKMKSMGKMANMFGKVMPGKMRDMKNYSDICKYFHVADYDNVYNMLCLILKEYGKIEGLPDIKPPREVSAYALTNPQNKKAYQNRDEFIKDFPYDESKPIIVFLYYAHIYPTDYSEAAAIIHKRFISKFNVIPIAVSGTDDFKNEEIAGICNSIYGKKPNVIVNTMSFRLSAGPMGGNHDAGISFLETLDAPYFHPVFMSRKSQQEWENSVQGFTPSEIMISVMLPEFDGALNIIPIGSMGDSVYHEKFDVKTDKIKIIDERLDKLIECAENYSQLSIKANSEKKIAIIGYNYPPGEGNLFGGAFLDTLVSLSNILSALKSEGYATESMTSEEILNEFLSKNLINSAKYSNDSDNMLKYPLKSYKKSFEMQKEKAEFIKAWGNPGGDIMTDDEGNFNIPAFIRGNVLLGLQPSRGLHEDQEKLYHDKTLPPHHQYVAFYEYLRDVFKADVIIHIGTHGTIEFLKGKECGMSHDCYPDMLIGNVPHIYLYYCGNAAECIIAKRRSHAQIISYQPPVFVSGDLYGEYSELSKLIDDYHHALVLTPHMANEVLDKVYEKAEKLNLPKDLEALEDELYRMNKSLIPKGLHAFGSAYNSEEAKLYVKSLTNYTRNGYLSRKEAIAQQKGYDLEELENLHKYKIIKELDEEADKIFEEFFSSEFKLKSQNQELDKTLSYAKAVYEKVLTNNEIKGLLHALDGGYTKAKSAGDIYRNPDILPTGENLIQFDSRYVPSVTAYERGVRIAENTIEAYKDEKDKYPSSAAVVLWGLETSRTQGETFSQILAYLGVRLSKKSSMGSPSFEIIPMEELNRPRIDVTINICGFFRDMFPNLIESLDDLFHELYELEETDEENYFKAHTNKILAQLLDEGYEYDEALDLAVSRIFGPKEGEYGTGLTSFVETKNWDEEEDLGNQFLSSLHFVYTRHHHGFDKKGLYEMSLKSVDIVSQLRDNQEYEITDLDHYYEFFGGLSKSVEMVKGTKACMLITDTTGDRVKTESVEKSISRGIRTRVLNPKWIDGMLNHKYHGTQEIASRFENVMGLAATTGSVEQWIYNDLHKTYVEDENMRKRLTENNIHAYMDILEQMMEYYNRGYWDATDEQIELIKKTYLETEDRIEENS